MDWNGICFSRTYSKCDQVINQQAGKFWRTQQVLEVCPINFVCCCSSMSAYLLLLIQEQHWVMISLTCWRENTFCFRNRERTDGDTEEWKETEFLTERLHFFGSDNWKGAVTEMRWTGVDLVPKKEQFIKKKTENKQLANLWGTCRDGKKSEKAAERRFSPKVKVRDPLRNMLVQVDTWLPESPSWSCIRLQFTPGRLSEDLCEILCLWENLSSWETKL